MLWKCCTQYASEFGKKQWSQAWKRSVFIPIPKNGNAKECSNYLTIAFISHDSKVMLKILQARLQQYVNHELPDVQAGFRKDRGIINQITNIHWIIEKAWEFQRSIQRECSQHSALLTTPKPLTVWMMTNWKILRDGNTRPLYLPPKKSVGRSGSNIRTGHGTTDWERST